MSPYLSSAIPTAWPSEFISIRERVSSTAPYLPRVCRTAPMGCREARRGSGWGSGCVCSASVVYAVVSGASPLTAGSKGPSGAAITPTPYKIGSCRNERHQGASYILTFLHDSIHTWVMNLISLNTHAHTPSVGMCITWAQHSHWLCYCVRENICDPALQTFPQAVGENQYRPTLSWFHIQVLIAVVLQCDPAHTHTHTSYASCSNSPQQHLRASSFPRCCYLCVLPYRAPSQVLSHWNIRHAFF